jgi:hypothetical protein
MICFLTARTVSRSKPALNKTKNNSLTSYNRLALPMWKIYVPVTSVFALALLLATNLSAQHPSDFGTIPLYFEQNKGQTDARAQYIARSPNLLGFVLQNGWTLSLQGQPISMHIKSANPNATLVPESPIAGITNYYLGSRAITALHHYSSVRANNIRPGIDIVYHGNQRELEYDLVIHPGADVRALWLSFDGSHPTLADNGDIVLKASTGEVHQHKPHVWQEANGQRTEVECHYVVAKSGDVGFVLSNYDRSAQLIVDPIISYSTYLSGTNTDTPTGIAVDAGGYAYVTGSTASTDFPVTFGTFQSGGDVFVTKLNPRGTGLVYSTFVGGSTLLAGTGRAIAIDNAGNAYVTGSTFSSEGMQHAFAFKLGSTGQIVYSTALAGNDVDIGRAIATDASGSAYIAGLTYSTNFPVTAGSYQTTLRGISDAFVVKLSSTGQISYATYLGGTGNDVASAIAVDATGSAFVGGSTASSDFPATTGAYATVFAGVYDAFIVKLNPTGSSLIYATYLGGSFTDFLNGLAVDAAGNCYVTGSTTSADFPTTPSAFSTNKGSASFYNSGFVTKLSANGASLVYSTFLGGSGSSDDYAVGIAVDSTGSTYVVGSATSTNFPTTPGALKTVPTYSSFCCDPDIFLSRVGADGNALLYSTRLGSSSGESANALALDGIGGVYIVGTSESTRYPVTAGAFQTSNPKGSGQSGLFSIVVSKIDFKVPTLCNPSVAPQSQSLPGRGGAISFNLTLSPGCPWEAVTNGLLTLTGPQYGVISSSPILITGTVPQNPSIYGGLTESIQIGTAAFTVNQDAGSCQDPVLSPVLLAFDSSGGDRNLSLILPNTCTWTAVSGAPWLSVSNRSSGNGPASITIFAAPNSFSSRSTTLTIAGKPITVTQTGSTCTAVANISLSSTSPQGGDGLASITTNSTACIWSAYSTAPWIQLNASASTGQGSGFVPFTFAANPGVLPRTGQILIANITLSVTQDAGPAGTISSYSASIVAGGGASSIPNRGDGGPALDAYLFAGELAFDPITSNLYILDSLSRVRVVTPDGSINTFAGGGTGTGENIPATSALLSSSSVAVDSSSAVYINDSGSRVRKISQGNIVTFAGGNFQGFSGDNGSATNATLNSPQGIAADSAGNVYISDKGNGRIRKISAGTITTFAGGGSSRDNGPATSASLSFPYGIALDAAANLLIVESTADGRVRKMTQGNITTVAGGGSGGDGGAATSALLNYPSAIAVDTLGSIFILEAGPGKIRKVSIDGTINTITGIVYAQSLTADRSGNVYFSDQSGLVRKLTALPSFCTYSVSTPAQIPQSGGSVQISVTNAAGCRWGALLVPAWLSPTSAVTGIGNGTITLTASPNWGTTPRSAALAIAGMPVVITQSGATPVLSVNRQTLNFATGINATATSPQTVNVSLTGGAGVGWTATSNQPNIVTMPSFGTGIGSFQVSASSGPNGTITVTAPNATGSPKQIQVNISSPSPGNPFGSFDTPADNTTGVAGAIPVTGWALDAVEVVKVDIWHEPVGDSVFVEGARPDVESLNPNVPFNYRAGWGYQMLTNFLPQGNGTFKLHAIAHNKAGNSTDLGTKTIIVDNAHASKPFGTLDTPGQGGTASGNAFVNFGWALTQTPNKIPIDGSTISVVIDGQVIGHPTYNQFRSDIASLFPGYSNSGGAVGFFYIDTTTLTNGVHTISWNVFDNAGHGEGLGSRYFTVFNTASTSTAPDDSLSSDQTTNRAAPVRKRFPTNAPTSIEIEELDHLELPVDATTGYQLVNGEHRPLPIGSSLKNGIFYWQPGPGFLGEFHLVFQKNDATDTHLRVTISPKSYAR